MTKSFFAVLVLIGALVGGLALSAGGQPAPDTLPAITSQAGLHDALTKATTPVILDFHASWCGPCRALTPELVQLQHDHSQEITIITIDVDEAPELATQYGVSSIPHLALLRDGRVAKQNIGYLPAVELAQWAGLTARK